MEIEKADILYKVLLVGDIGSGKTSIIKNYVHGVFSPNYKSTIGVDFALKVLKGEEQILRLQLWDIAGQERYGQMTRVYYKDAVGAFVVFDVTRQTTFDMAKKWKADVDSKLTIPVFLLANKVDLITEQADDWHQRRLEMDKFCNEQGFADWFETSAKSGFGIDPAFEALIVRISTLFPLEERGVSDSSLIRLVDSDGDSKKECC